MRSDHDRRCRGGTLYLEGGELADRVRLVADLLCLWIPQGEPPGAAVDAVVDRLGRAVAAYIARARSQPALAPARALLRRDT